jgi:hypothetical protein
VEKVRGRVEKFCGDCHVMPRPSSLARDHWEKDVNMGFRLYGESGRTDLEIPPYEEVLKYFEYQAPEQLQFPAEIADYRDTDLSFEQASVRLPGQRPPGITNVAWIELAGGPSARALVYCDIGTGAVNAFWPSADASSETPAVRRLATLFQPVHVEPCDLDQDGVTDLLVCDIGEFDANDSEIGRVVWLRQDPQTHQFTAVDLKSGMSRVADARTADFDADGDPDVLVAEFGWRKTGRITLLENLGASADDAGTAPAAPTFQAREIDSRHGAVHIPVIDFDDDGDLDFVVLFSQEHECVEVFLNDGAGSFEQRVLWRAPDPAYGSCGIELVDLDADGDTDVLLSNGDSFDRGPKPYHGVQWLENRGEFAFEHHHLCHLPGVMAAKAGDFDGDGDLDVAAAALLAGPTSRQLRSSALPSIVILRQGSDGSFTPTRVENSVHTHATLLTDDFNRDGRADFVVGNLLREAADVQSDLTIWYNRAK